MIRVARHIIRGENDAAVEQKHTPSTTMALPISSDLAHGAR